MRTVVLLLLLAAPWSGAAQKMTTQDFIKKYPVRDTLVVTEGKATLYAGPSKGTEDNGAVVKGEFVFGFRDQREFVLVFTNDDSYGFIERKHVHLANKSGLKHVADVPVASEKVETDQDGNILNSAVDALVRAPNPDLISVKYRYIAAIFISRAPIANDFMMALDVGQSMKWKDLKKAVENPPKLSRINFNTEIDGLNFLAQFGWELISTSQVSTSMPQAVPGLVTKFILRQRIE